MKYTTLSKHLSDYNLVLSRLFSTWRILRAERNFFLSCDFSGGNNQKRQREIPLHAENSAQWKMTFNLQYSFTTITPSLPSPPLPRKRSQLRACVDVYEIIIIKRYFKHLVHFFLFCRCLAVGLASGNVLVLEMEFSRWALTQTFNQLRGQYGVIWRLSLRSS